MPDTVERLIAIGRTDLAERLKHLAGKHNQARHGWRFAKGGDDAARLGAARRSLRGRDAGERAEYRKRAGMPEAKRLERKQPQPKQSAEDIEKAYMKVGSLWERDGKRRIYFNGLEDLYDGLKVWRYNSGNVSGATLDGESISNSQAKRILGRLIGSSLYYDLDAKKLMTRNIHMTEDDIGRLVRGVKKKAGLLK